MNDEGGCCIAKYGGGGGEGMYGLSKVDRIMLKFRPIAPKPVVAGSGSSSGSTTDNGKDAYVKCGRSKRRYVRVNKSKNDNFKRRGGEKMKVKGLSSPPQVVTLPLLPETPDRKENEPVTGFLSDMVTPIQRKCTNNNKNKRFALAPPVWLNFTNQEEDTGHSHTAVVKPAPRLPQVVSYVTVECVTDTWVDREVLGCSDEEIVMNMEKDTCPGFISDGQDRVVWMNKAYRHMAGVGHGDIVGDISVVLVWKDKWARSPVMFPAFTCKVRVAFAGSSHRETLWSSSPTLTLPCDVWRMECGTFAWRLDVKAALSLGR